MRWFAGLLLAAVCVGSGGCVLPSRYGTPRTLPEGMSQHVVGVEMFATDLHIAFDEYDEGERRRSLDVGGPLPSYTWRKGLWDGGELGLGFASSFGLIADLKLAAYRSEWFDLALAPTIGAAPWFLPNVAFLESVPVLAGINLARWVTLVPSAGITAMQTSAGGASVNLSYGGSVQFRVSQSIAIQPGLVAYYYPGDETRFFHGGLSLLFGEQPGYGAAPLQPDRWE